MKKQVIALKRHNGDVEINGIKIKLLLPEGCTGFLFCFESKKSARKYWGKDISLVEFELEEKELDKK